jgi:NADH-quinone oxidoreductase subunit G
MAKLTIDGQAIEVPDGTRLFDACTEARGGEPLPHFCYHPDLSIAGVCRLCQVEVEGMPKLTISCNTIVKDDMVVHTKSDRVLRAAEQILEMHLINHPVDCPICDQAGECGLQDQYMKFGLYESKVEVADKVKKDKVVVIGPHVVLDEERCVLCSRCVRFCYEITGTRELGIFNRGDRAEIGVSPGRQLDNNYSLNTVDICPVGALTSRDFRFRKRVWMLKSTPSVCPGCATGCNMRIDHDAGRVYRLKPRRNNEVNGPWMCDMGRMLYKTVHDENRLVKPLRRENGELRPVSWEKARRGLNELLRPGAVHLAVASPRQSLEELVLFRMLVRQIAGEDQLVGGLADDGIAEGDDLLLSADRTPNRRALAWLGLPELPAADLVSRLPASEDVVLVYGTDLAADPVLEAALAGRESVVYLGTHANATTRAATLVIPTSTWAEKDGLFVNGEGRIQSFHRAVAPAEEAGEDWRLLADLLESFPEIEVPRDRAALRQLVGAELGLPAGTDLDNVPPAGLLLDLGVPELAGGER